MRVTVIGGSGVLGRRTVRLLQHEGHDVRVPVRSQAAAERVATAGVAVGDVWDPRFLHSQIEGSDAVVMLATAIPKSTDAVRASAWRTNDRVRGQLAPLVADMAAECGVVTLVQESVMFVYASAADPITERSTLAPGVVARSALIAECGARGFVRSAPEQGKSGPSGSTSSSARPRAVALRFALFVAPDSEQAVSALDLARRAGLGLALGDLAGWTTYVAVDDAAAAVVRALDLPTGVYNVGAHPVTKAQWLATMSSLLGRTVSAPPDLVRRALPRLAPTTEGLSRSLGLDSSVLRSYGWRPRYESIDEIWGQALPGRG